MIGVTRPEVLKHEEETETRSQLFKQRWKCRFAISQFPNWFIHLATTAQTNFSPTNHRIAVIFNMQESISSSLCKVKVLSQIKVKLQEYVFHTDVEFVKCFTRARPPICFILPHLPAGEGAWSMIFSL